MKTAIKNLILIFVIVSGTAFAQSSAWQWARSAGSTGSEAAMGSVLDASGNLYVVGWYTSANITFGGTTLTNPGSFTSDIFLVKYNSAGTALWAKTFGSADGDNGNGIAVDASGNVYITGWYTGATLVMDTYTLTNAATASSDVFIAKIDPLGNTVWAKSAGGTLGDRGLAITVDAFGNVFTTGGYSSSIINFGTGNLTNTNASTNDIFLVKHTSSGTTLWSKSVTGAGADVSNSVATDSLGNVYITGIYSGSTIDFGVGPLANFVAGTQDLFVAKYDDIGNAVWSKRAGGSLDDYGNSIAVRKGEVYITGTYNSSSLAFGTTTLTNASAGTGDFLLAKYDLSGNSVWAKKAGGSDYEAGNAVTVDSLGDIYVSGFFASNSITFNTSTITNSTGGYRDLFVTKFDLNGNAVWAVSGTAGTFDETANCVSVNSTGTDVYVGGVFNSSSVAFGTNTIFKGCGDDVFVAKLLGALVGIQEEYMSNQLMLYPNPNSGKFTIKAEGQITFYNVLGETILSKKLSDKNQMELNEFDFSSYPKGVYLYRVFTEKKGTYTGRVVIE